MAAGGPPLPMSEPMSETAASEQERAIDPLTPTAAASQQGERRLEDLAQFVQKWHKENGRFVLGEEQVQNACQEGYADGLTLSENLKALGPIFDAENAPSFEDTEAIKKRLSEEKLPTKLLQEYYLRFFSSLRIAEQVAKIAVTSEALSEANKFFDPTKYMSESLDMETLTKFWASAAPELAAMTLKALKAKKTFAETQHSDKFRGDIKLGDLDAFYLGLDGVIGLPRQGNFLEAMQEEHASDEDFSAWNQGQERSSSPQKEWQKVLPNGIVGAVNTMSYDETQDLCEHCKSNFEEHPMVKKADLQMAEIVALRLYTSPMYFKYNAELRNLLEAFLHLQDRSTSGSFRTRHGVALHHKNTSETSVLVEEARQSMEGVGYVTTIHAIVSGLIKLSKIGVIVGRAYRGIHGKSIPSCFLLPGASGSRGGVEYGFMSTSKSKLAAMSYASTEGAAGMPLVFEILTGAVDRGADLSWISYFPGEEEILLPPLSNLELAGFPRYEAIAEIEEEASRTASSSAGKLVMIIPLQVNVNLKGFTLDQLQQRRKDLHIQTFENLISEVEREFHALEPEAGEEERAGPSLSRNVSEPAGVGGGRRLSQEQIELGKLRLRKASSPAIRQDARAVFLGGGIWWDRVRSVFMPKRGGQEQSKTATRNDFKIFRDVVLKQCREVLQNHIRRDKLEFNDDIKYKEALDEALSTKVRAKRKLQVLLHRLGLESPAVFESIKSTPLGEFTVDYRYYPLLSGLEDNSADAKVEGFPWKNICEGSWSAREVVLEKRTSEFLEHRISPFQLRLALQCISDHRKVVQTLWYGSFCFQQQALSHRVELTPSRPIQAAEQHETDQSQLHSKEVPTITYGDLRICSIPEEDPTYPSHETIQLRFCKTPLSHDGGLFICNVVLGSKDLVSLDLSGCKLFSAGSRYLAKGLQHCSPSLTRLDLRQCALGLGGGQAVLEALQGATNLKTLSIRNNVLSPEGWSSLAGCLQAASSLTSLDIAYCCLYSDSAPKLTTALQGLEHLQILDICGSIMDKQIAASIAEAVGQLPALREVNKVKVGRGVSGEGVSESVWKDEKLYNFGEEDAGLVAAIIRTNTQLTQLNNLDPKHDCDGNDKTWVITGFLKMWKRSDAPIAFLQNQLARSDCEMQIKLEETTFGGAGDAERLKAHVEACIMAQNEGKVKAKAAHFDDRRRLLEVAAQKNDVEEVRLLQGAGSIGGGQGDNFDFSYGQRMLVQAGLSGGPEVCMCLIAGTEASRLELKDMEGRTSLMRAARDGREAVVRTLIWKGANVNAEDSEGRTALMMAAGRGWDNVVEILLSCNANIEQRNKEGWNAFHSAAMYAPDRTVITLLEHATENAVSMAGAKKGNTPLHYAATFGKQRIVCTLLAAKAPADCQSKTLRTPLMEASAGGNKYILDSLLQAKASVNSVDRRGTTALMEAAKKGHVDLVEKLALAEQKQGNDPPRTSMAAVREVLPRNASFGSLSSMLGFRRAGSNSTKCINKQDEQMWTALMLAVSHSHANVALALLNLPPEHGLDVNLAQHEGRTALMLAAANGLRADHQHQQNPKPEDTRVHPKHFAEIVPLVLHSERTRKFLVTILVEKNADIAARDKTGRTAVIEAARNGHCEVVEKLLSLDADPNAKTNNGWTALMFAADKGHASVVDVLLNRKVDTDVKGKDGRTALDLAIRKGHEKVVKRLSVLETNSQRPYDQGMVIVPYEVPRRFLPYLAARDKYDLMHNRGQAISFRLDTKVFQIEPLNELFQTNIKSTLKKLPTSLEMLSSPLAAVTLKGEARATADIPKDACYFSFCYPTTLFEKLDHTVFENSDDNSADEFVVFLRIGAFVYYNSTYDIIKLNALNVYEKMHSPEAGLSFDTDLPMQSTSVEYLERWNRWTVVTVEFLREKGFTHFAWINPSEVLGDSYINPYGGFAYRNADRTAVFYPVCLDGDGNVLTAPAAPFTCKVDGTSDEDSMSDIESDSEQRSSLGTDGVPGMSRVRSSKSLEQADGTDSVVKSRQRRKEAISGVTGLLEVRTEVVEKLLDHLLSYAKEERERLSKHLVTQDGTELSPDDILQEFTFTADQPHTWTAHDLPVSADTDTPLEREEKLLQLAEMHACVPAERQLRMPLPINLLQVSHFGPPDKRQSIADHLFCEDVDTLNRSRRRRIILYLNRDVLEWTSDRTKTYLSKSKSVRRIHPMVRETSASSASSGSKLSTPPSGTEQQFFKLVGSPLNQVTLPEDVQVRAGIPKQAKFYCFCYPLLHDKVEELASKHRRTPTDALGSFLRLGGFLYFNEMYEVVSITALSVSAADKSETRCVLHLGPSLDLPTTAIKPLQRAKRWWPVTHKAAARLGYSHMAYIRPCEVLADHVFCGHGGFVYCSAQHNKAHFYPVMSSFYDIDYGEEQRYRRRYQPRKFHMWIDRREGPALRAARPARFVNGSIPLLDHHHHQHQQQQQQPHQPHGQHGQHRQPLPASPIIVEDQEGLSAPADEDPSEEEDVKEEALAAVRREVGAAECCAQLITGQTLAGLLERREAALAGLAKSELAALRVWTCGCSTSRKGFASTPGWQLTRALVHSGVGKLQRLAEDCARILHSAPSPIIQGPSSPPRTPTIRSILAGYEAVPEAAGPRRSSVKVSEEAAAQLREMALLDGVEQHSPLPPPGGAAGGAAGDQRLLTPVEDLASAEYLWAWKGAVRTVLGAEVRAGSGAQVGGGSDGEEADKLMQSLRGGWEEELCLAATKDFEVAAALIDSDGSLSIGALARDSNASLPTGASAPIAGAEETATGVGVEKGEGGAGAAGSKKDGEDGGSGAGMVAVLLRIKCARAEEMPADLSWLSSVPAEHEVLFAPGTLLQPLFAQRLLIRRSPDVPAFVVTCRPVRPTDQQRLASPEFGPTPSTAGLNLPVPPLFPRASTSSNPSGAAPEEGETQGVKVV